MAARSTTMTVTAAPRLDPPVTRHRGLNDALHPDRAWIRVLRLGLAAFVAAAVVKNTIDSATGANDTDLVQHFSLFTIQSGIAFAVVLAIGALVPRARLPRWWDDVRGATVFYMVMTGLVYAILVAEPGENLRLDIGWTGWALHRAGPALALLGWLGVTMTRRSGWGRPLAWLGFPVAWLVYTWVRGGVAGWYPYDFLDPLRPGGWADVLATTAQVLIAFLAVALVLHVLGVARAWLARGRDARGRDARARVTR